MERGCPSCGRMIDADAQRCPYCNYDFANLNKMFKNYASEREIKVPKYAGLIKRMAANSIDLFILFVLFSIIEFVYLLIIHPQILVSPSIDYFASNPMAFLPYMILPIVYLLYCTFMQSSDSMATFGEQFVGVEVMDDLNSGITFGMALKRNIFRILNILTAGIGLLTIVFTPEKQGLNDIISGTFVINKVTKEESGGHVYAHLFRRFAAFMIDIVILLVIYFVFSYAISSISTLNFDLKNTIKTGLYILMYMSLICYFPYTESHRGSLGKRLMGIRTCTMEGDRISEMKAFVVLLSLLVELLMFPFATLLAFVTPKKQTFKDLLTETIVIDF